MSKVRVFNNADGSTSVFHPAPQSKRLNETEAEWFQRVSSKATPEGVSFEDVDASVVPANRRFRNQWKAKVGGIEVDLANSKKQVLKELRKKRNKELKETDSQMAKENEQGDNASQKNVKDYRKKLRDLPETIHSKIDAITTIEDLESQYPQTDGEEISYYITKSEE